MMPDNRDDDEVGPPPSPRRAAPRRHEGGQIGLDFQDTCHWQLFGQVVNHHNCNVVQVYNHFLP